MGAPPKSAGSKLTGGRRNPTSQQSKRNARFQQWQALLENRTKRLRQREFLVHGVRPINEAFARGWPIRALLHDGSARSRWARDLLANPAADQVVCLAPELLAELGQKDDDKPELIAVAQMPPDDLDRVPLAAGGVAVILDRPSNPGNIGTVLRSADALGAAGVIVAGRAADVYDPKAVRASRGSLFAVPAVRIDAPMQVVQWLRGRGEVRILAASEDAAAPVWAQPLRGTIALVVGNEATGLSSFWAEACDDTISIPMQGSASSLNAAVAASIALYERHRQRHA